MMVKHIGYCCGYESFLYELFDGPLEEAVINPIDHDFFFHLLHILDQDIRNQDIYERLWGCIPFLKRLMGGRAPYEFGICKVLGDSIKVTPNLIMDFVLCSSKFSYFRALVERFTRRSSFHVYVEDIGKLIDLGFTVPDCLIKIYNKVSPVMKYEKEFIACHNKLFEHITKVSPYLCIYTDKLYTCPNEQYSCYVELVLQGHNKIKKSTIRSDKYDVTRWSNVILNIDKDMETFLCRETIMQDFSGYLNLEDFQVLLNSLSISGVPLHCDNDEITLQKPCFAKSALK